MTNKVFKAFKRLVEMADSHSDVWYAGYMWMDLTTRQTAQIDEILRQKGFINVERDNHGKWHVFPNGLKFKAL